MVGCDGATVIRVYRVNIITLFPLNKKQKFHEFPFQFHEMYPDTFNIKGSCVFEPGVKYVTITLEMIVTSIYSTSIYNCVSSFC